MTKNIKNRLLIVLALLLSTNLAFGQISGVVVNSETKEPIPYVNIWVEDANIGATSNLSGEFSLPKIAIDQILIFSSIGFETKRLELDSKTIQKQVELDPKITELEEVVVLPNQGVLQQVIGSFKKSTIYQSFGCSEKPWIVARFFPYSEHYHQTNFLKSIKFLTKSDVQDAKFNVRLYTVNEQGEPGNYLFDKNIFGIAKKGSKITIVNLSTMQIEFPKSGFFIAIEWLIIEPNKYEFKYTMEGSKRKYDGISFEPSFGTIPSKTAENSWIYSKGKWRKVWKNENQLNHTFSSNYDGKYDLIAIELTLSN